MNDMKVINKDVELYRKFSEGANKPKLKKLFELVEMTPNPFQEQVIDYVDNRYREWATLFFSCGRRSSKSTTAGLIAVLEMLVPNSSVALVAPSNKQLSIIFDDVVKTLRKLNIPINKLDTNGKLIRLENNSVFRGGSETTISSMEGVSISKLIIDEIYLIKSIDRILGSLSPALSTYGVYEDTKMPVGKVIMLGSVKPNLQAKAYYDKGKRQEKGYVTLEFSAYENPLLSKDFLEAEREKLGDALFRQEYLAEFTMLHNSMVFGDFDYAKNTCDTSPIKNIINKDSILISALDIGFKDATAYVMFYYEAGKYYLIDYFNINQISEKEIAQNIKALESKYPIEPEIRFIDPSAALSKYTLSQDHELIFYSAMNNIKEGIALMNQLFREGRLFIDRSFTEVIEQFQSLEWKDNITSNRVGDPFKRKSGQFHSDIVHSCRYALFTHYRKYVNGAEITTI